MRSELILASASPRRIALLRQLGVRFRHVASGVEEIREGSDPAASAEAAALQKAGVVAECNPGAVVVGADTVVISSEGEVLGKPTDPNEAVEILMKLSGQAHTVITAVAVLGPDAGEEEVASESTTVWMRPFSEAEARRYVSSGEPMDKAGAYGIQVRGALLVERIEGCYFNVVGFPLVLLQKLLRARGIDPAGWLGPEPTRPHDS